MELFRINVPRQQNPVPSEPVAGGGAAFSDYLRAAKFHGIIRVAAAKMHVKN